MVVDAGNARPLPAASMSPKELSDNDDLATSLVLDPYLGFTTHKMNAKHRSLKAHDDEQLQDIVDEFVRTQNADKAFKRLLKGDWVPRHMLNRDKLAQKRLKEHVSCDVAVFMNRSHQHCVRIPIRPRSAATCASSASTRASSSRRATATRSKTRSAPRSPPRGTGAKTTRSSAWSAALPSCPTRRRPNCCSRAPMTSP